MHIIMTLRFLKNDRKISNMDGSNIAKVIKYSVIFEKSKRHDYMHNIKVIYILDSDIFQVILVFGSLKTFFFWF